jgi:UDP-N-acetylglucosamine--N-acetylmuramyl-(pentapeptide) pyrophosphoryl-undecaprenol N-acetylglucosamine transferase
MQKKILISTGGSGGHVVPATILHDHLSEKTEVIISTDRRGYKYIDKTFDNVEIIDTPKLNNSFFLPLNLIIVLFLSIKSFFLLKKKKIECVFSTGGYMSLPLILAAKILNLKIYLLEPNLVLGRANKLFLRFSEKIFCYTDQIKKFPYSYKNKLVIIKPLVRKEYYNTKIDEISNSKFNLLVVGGSQGAKIFDNNLKGLIVDISKEFSIRITQQTNKKNISNLREFYSNNNIESLIFDYDNNFVDKVSEADLCITRAGATTLAELSILHKPFIAIPLPTSKDNHQFENANFYLNKNCCWVIKQNDLELKIGQILREILKDKSDLLLKKDNLKKLNYQNTWINVNQKILSIINEN